MTTLSITRTRDPRWDTLEKARHYGQAPAGGYGDFRGGQFIPAEAMRFESNLAQNAFEDMLADFGRELQYLRQVYEMSVMVQHMPDTLAKPNWVPLSETEERMRICIARCYSRAAVLGRRAGGNLTSIPAETAAEMAKVKEDEYLYLEGFIGHMETHGGVMPYEQRMDMYAKAIREAYWVGWLSAQPKDAKITWHVGPTEHCESCLRFSKHGPYSVADFRREVAGQGYYPQAGKLACLGYHCKCWLASDFSTQRPAWIPGEEQPESSRKTVVQIKRTPKEPTPEGMPIAGPMFRGAGTFALEDAREMQAAIDALPDPVKAWVMGPAAPPIVKLTPQGFAALNDLRQEREQMLHFGIVAKRDSGGDAYAAVSRTPNARNLLEALALLYLLKHEQDNTEFRAAIEDGKRIHEAGKPGEDDWRVAERLHIRPHAIRYISCAVSAYETTVRGEKVTPEDRAFLIAMRLKDRGDLLSLWGVKG